MTNEEQLELYYSVVNKNYTAFKKKMKQFCFLNHLDFDEDTFQETILKVAEMTLKRGLKDTTEQGIMSYIFMSFKLNTYQTHLQESKRKKDDNVDVFKLDLEDIPYDESQKQYADMAVHYILNKVKEAFDPISAGVWRLRYMVTLNRRGIKL